MYNGIRICERHDQFYDDARSDWCCMPLDNDIINKSHLLGNNDFRFVQKINKDLNF